MARSLIMRKKWRLKLFPSFTYQPESSMRKAYERVEQLRSDYAAGHSHTHHVNVEVDDGSGWALYERIVFPAAGSASGAR
jgi:hypothetical protein